MPVPTTLFRAGFHHDQPFDHSPGPSNSRRLQSAALPGWHGGSVSRTVASRRMWKAGRFAGSTLTPIRSRSASPRATRRALALCSGPGSPQTARTRGRPAARKDRGELGACVRRSDEERSFDAGPRWPHLSSRIRSTSKSTASSRIAGTGTAFARATRPARSAARGPCPPMRRSPERLRFAFASCQHYEQGLFTAYERMAQGRSRPRDSSWRLHLRIRRHRAAGAQARWAETRSLDDYRIRYAQYRTDPHLQQMHARCPWIVTPDDHEVDNNYANAISEEKNVDPVDFLERRARAYQAYYEMMPLRKRSLPRGPSMRLYRSVRFGRLAEFQVLDTRQYRTDQPNGDRRSPLNEAALSSQEHHARAGAGGLASIAFARVRGDLERPGAAGDDGHGRTIARRRAEAVYSMDQWPGYARERIELVKFLAERRVPNPVVLTGDIHSNWVNDLRVDDRQAESPVVATEFVGTSISTGGNGYDKARNQDRLLSDNPCVRFHNGQRGYVRCTITPRELAKRLPGRGTGCDAGGGCGDQGVVRRRGWQGGRDAGMTG